MAVFGHAPVTFGVTGAGKSYRCKAKVTGAKPVDPVSGRNPGTWMAQG